jgi:hypothetical protein
MNQPVNEQKNSHNFTSAIILFPHWSFGRHEACPQFVSRTTEEILNDRCSNIPDPLLQMIEKIDGFSMHRFLIIALQVKVTWK